MNQSPLPLFCPLDPQSPPAAPRRTRTPLASTRRPAPTRISGVTPALGYQPTLDGMPSPAPRDLDWSWGFSDAVLAVLSEDPSLLAGSAVRDVHIALSQATAKDDIRRATDYGIRLRLPTVTLALRVRRFAYLQAFGGEVVFRLTADPQHSSEAEKVLTHTDAADRYLYAWAAPDEQHFAQWVVLDLVRLRRIWADPDRRAGLNSRPIPMRGSSRGLVLPIADLITNRVVIRALLARPAFPSIEQAEEFLRGCRQLDTYSSTHLREVATFMAHNALTSHYYIGPEPL